MNNSKLLDIGLFKTIPLYPTLFHVDIWICNNPDNLSEYFHKRYGAGKEYHREKLQPNQTCTVVATQDSELQGIKTIVVNMDNWDNNVIVHEMNHVIYHLADICGLETGTQNQEWISYMLEYLFARCQNDGSFQKCDQLNKNQNKDSQKKVML